MIHSGIARINRDAAQRSLNTSIKQQALRANAIALYEAARFDIAVDPRHLETLRINAYGA